jgi:hypothetical protein
MCQDWQMAKTRRKVDGMAWEEKKKFHSTKVRLNFLVAWRHGTSFIMTHREKVRHPALFLFPLASSPTHMRKKGGSNSPLSKYLFFFSDQGKKKGNTLLKVADLKF